MKQLSVSQVLNDLNNGLTRDQIKEKYELNFSEMKMLFNHPKLKGKRAKTAGASLMIIDDSEEPTLCPSTGMIPFPVEVSDSMPTNTDEEYNHLVEQDQSNVEPQPEEIDWL